MLSILIPIYNVAVDQLIEDLSSQADALDVAYEIICIDDASTNSIREENRNLVTLPTVQYHQLADNIGRSKIRNLLAQKASHHTLLFLDCDAKIVRPDFIEKYLKHTEQDQVVIGGRTYPPKPRDSNKRLHWKFGTIREQGNRSAFQSNNFLIPRHIMLKFPFDEQILTYGHEDTLLGHELTHAGVELHYIDNPVLHNDLIDVGDFLQKQRDALVNLTLVTSRFPSISTRFTRTIEKLNRWRLIALLQLIYPYLKTFCQRHLLLGSTSLLLLDLFKIACYLEISENDK